MNFQQLRYVLTIYEQGSISKAAEKLFITQSALSQHLLKTESELGIKIFDRSTIPISPTFAGIQFINFSQNVLYEESQMYKTLEDITNMNVGKLTIGIPSNRSLQILPLVLPKFSSDYPAIQLQVKESRSTVLETLLLNNEIDMACMGPEINSPVINFTKLVKENIYLAVPNNNPLNEKISEGSTVSPALFNDFPFILIKKGHKLRSVADELFYMYSMTPRCILETSNIDLAIQLSAQGLGVSFISELSAKLFHGDIKPTYYLLNPQVSYYLGIACHKQRHRSNAMKLFVKYIEEGLKVLGL